MTGSENGAPTPPWPQPLVLSAEAHGNQVRVLRRGLAVWLRQDHLEADQVDDLVAATSEALENCCDHAYDPARGTGTMTLTARCLSDDDRGGLVIIVEDGGSWRAPRAQPGSRGRGMAMMRALVDDVVVETGTDGTRIALVHHA